MFGTSARIAADPTQPHNRRLTNLSNAIEKFPIFGFNKTFEQLNLATGSSRDEWTADQITVASRLLMRAHESWREFATEAMRDARRRKRLPGYEPLRIHGEVFQMWRDTYFDDLRAAEWGFDGTREN